MCVTSSVIREMDQRFGTKTEAGAARENELSRHSGGRDMANNEATTQINLQNPPVDEVDIGVNFKSTGLQAVHVAAFWNEIKKEFPTAEERVVPPYALEGARRTGSAGPKMILGGSPQRRIQCFDAKRESGIQLQTDLFAFGWMKGAAGQRYPGFAAVKQRFDKYWSEFSHFVVGAGFPTPEVLQVEMSYSDVIPIGDGWSSPSDVPDLFRPWKGIAVGTELTLEDLAIRQAFTIPDGRMHVNFGTGVRSRDKVEALVLNTIFRQRLAEGRSVSSSLDYGHQLSLQIFISCTTDKAHAIWGKII